MVLARAYKVRAKPIEHKQPRGDIRRILVFYLVVNERSRRFVSLDCTSVQAEICAMALDLYSWSMLHTDGPVS